MSIEFFCTGQVTSRHPVLLVCWCWHQSIMPMRHTWAWAAGLRPTVRLTVGNLLRTPCAGSAVSPPRTAPAVSLCAWAPSTRPLAQVCPSDTTLGVSAATAGALQPLQRARENRIRNGVIGAGQGEGVRGVGTVHRGKIIGNVVEAWEQRTVRELESARDPAHFDDFKVGDSVAVQFVNVWNRQKLAIFAGICIARRGGQVSAHERDEITMAQRPPFPFEADGRNQPV